MRDAFVLGVWHTLVSYQINSHTHDHLVSLGACSGRHALVRFTHPCGWCALLAHLIPGAGAQFQAAGDYYCDNPEALCRSRRGATERHLPEVIAANIYASVHPR